jgi:hypothetical protein
MNTFPFSRYANLVDATYTDDPVSLPSSNYRAVREKVVQEKIFGVCGCAHNPNWIIRIVPGIQRGFWDNFPLVNFPTARSMTTFNPEVGTWLNTLGNYYQNKIHTKEGNAARFAIPVHQWRLCSQTVQFEPLGADTDIKGYFVAYRTIHPGLKIFYDYMEWLPHSEPNQPFDPNRGYLDYSGVDNGLTNYHYDGSMVIDELRNIGLYKFHLNPVKEDFDFHKINWKMDQNDHPTAGTWDFETNKPEKAADNYLINEMYNMYDHNWDNIIVQIFFQEQHGMLPNTEMKVKCTAHHQYIIDTENRLYAPVPIPNPDIVDVDNVGQLPLLLQEQQLDVDQGFVIHRDNVAQARAEINNDRVHAAVNLLENDGLVRRVINLLTPSPTQTLAQRERRQN